MRRNIVAALLIATLMVTPTLASESSEVQLPVVGTVDPLVINVEVPLTLQVVVDPNIEGVARNKQLAFIAPNIQFNNKSYVNLNVGIGEVRGVGDVGSYPTLVEELQNYALDTVENSLDEVSLRIQGPDGGTQLLEGSEHGGSKVIAQIHPNAYGSNSQMNVRLLSGLTIAEATSFAYTIEYVFTLEEEVY